MPTIFEFKGYRFFFFSSDRDEPIHVHVEKENSHCKFWLNPIRVASNSGFRSHELSIVRKIITNRKDIIEEKWNEFFAR